MGAVVGQVPSLTRTGESYAIEQTWVGLVCACQRFVFGKRGHKSCTHVRIYRAAEKALRHCRAQHGTADGLCQACLIALLVTSVRKVRRIYKAKKEE